MGPWIGISLVICSVALLRWVTARTRRQEIGQPLATQVLARLAALEQRLADVQELMLAVDEKLEEWPAPRRSG